MSGYVWAKRTHCGCKGRRTCLGQNERPVVSQHTQGVVELHVVVEKQQKQQRRDLVQHQELQATRPNLSYVCIQYWV